MPKKKKDAQNVLVNAFEESKGEVVDLIVEHDDISGITPEMFTWWFVHIGDTNRYRMWVDDHILYEWEIPPSEDRPFGWIMHLKEKIGGIPLDFRLRGEDPTSLPIPPKYRNVMWASILGPDDKPMGWIGAECEERAGGMKLRSISRFPVKTPQWFLDGMREHFKKEMRRLTEFLPELYKKEAA